MAEIQYKPPVITSDGKAEWPIDPNTGVPTPKQVSINSDTDGLKNNLEWSKRAVEWANRYIRYADNRFEDKLMTAGGSYACVSKVRSEFDTLVTTQDIVQRVKERARIGMHYGCGNCDEQSAAAFVWLLKYYMVFSNNGSLARIEIANKDHIFLIIGFPAGKANSEKEWGPRSVVVDPWNYKAYPAAEIRTTRFMAGGEVYRPLVELPDPGRRHRVLK